MGSILTSPTLHLFRVLFASWRFFDDTFSAPILQLRTFTNDSQAIQPEWKDAIPKRGQRLPWNLFLNPKDLSIFSKHALIRQWLTDIQLESESKTSFNLVKNLVEFEVRNLMEHNREITSFEFRLLLEGVQIFTSERLTLSK